MKSPSIEWLHTKIDKQIRLAESYTEVEGLEFIIKACRLKPYDYIFEERDNGIILQERWFDEFGNSLNIKKKKVQIVYNDLTLDKNKITCTDLYYGLSIDKIAKMSKLVHLIAGKDEDLYQDCFLLTFLGIDEHLRSYLYWYGEWQIVSPLIMGIKNLKILASHADIKYFQKIENKEKSAVPCISDTAWLSYLPTRHSLLSMIRQQYEILLPIFEQ